MINGDYINAYEDLKESISRSSEYSENLDIPEGTMMTVPEMRKLLGLKKTESYHLVKKQYFETQVVLGKIRINRESFEKWYANQVIYQKVTGEEPGLELKKKSLSPKDIAEMLSLSESYVYEVMDNAGIKPVIVNFHKRFPVEEFQKWYKGQNRYRNAEDHKADEKLLREAISMPEMAKLLGLTRHDLPPVVFHSLRHTSVTYKLKLNGGDVKSVQGDSGHSQSSMVTEVYSHIIDSDRKHNVELFEQAFYNKGNLAPEMKAKAKESTVEVPANVDAELLAKVLSNPEMAALLTALAKTII